MAVLCFDDGLVQPSHPTQHSLAQLSWNPSAGPSLAPIQAPAAASQPRRLFKTIGQDFLSKRFGQNPLLVSTNPKPPNLKQANDVLHKLGTGIFHAAVQAPEFRKGFWS